MSGDGIWQKAIVSRDQDEPAGRRKEGCSGQRNRSVQRPCVRSDAFALEEGGTASQIGDKWGQAGSSQPPRRALRGLETLTG